MQIKRQIFNFQNRFNSDISNASDTYSSNEKKERKRENEKAERRGPKCSHAKSRVQPQAVRVAFAFRFCGARFVHGVTPSRARTLKYRPPDSIEVTVTTSGKGISISIICTTRPRLVSFSVPLRQWTFDCSRFAQRLDNSVEWRSHVAMFTRR